MDRGIPWTRGRASVLTAFASALALLVALLGPTAVAASGPGWSPTQWTVMVGAQSPDGSTIVSTYFPREIWVDEGDTINFVNSTMEPHTVTFLSGNPAPPLSSPAFGGNTYNGTGLVNSGTLIGVPFPGATQSFSLTFTRAGTYTYVCLYHPDMTGTVHVQPKATPYPETQQNYNEHSQTLINQFMAGGKALDAQGLAAAAADPKHLSVTAGIGNGVVSEMKFLPNTLTVPVGATVTWTTRDPMEIHTVTFGPEPQGPNAEFIPVGVDGKGHATITHVGQQVSSGAFGAPFGATTFQVTFTAPGVYQYICMLHDGMGMTGTIVVGQGGAVANDGQTLEDQPAETQATFRAVFGANADQEWVREHNAALAAR